MSEQNFAGQPSDSQPGTQPSSFAVPSTSPYQAQPVAPAPEVTGAPRRLPMTRRNVLRAAGVASVVAAAAGTVAALRTSSDETSTSTAARGPAVNGPVVAYLRDGSTGTIEIFAGTSKKTIRDTALATRLASAAR